MMPRHIFHIFCLVASIAIAPKPAFSGVELTEKEIESLARGELVVQPLPGSGRNSIVAGVSFALINASPERIWAALLDIPSWPAIFPNTFESQTVAVDGNFKSVRMKLGNRLFTFAFYMTVSLKREKWEATYVLNANKPHDIEQCRGFLRLIPQPEGRTLVVFSTLVEFPFAGLINLMGPGVIKTTEQRVLSVPERLKKKVEGW